MAIGNKDLDPYVGVGHLEGDDDRHRWAREEKLIIRQLYERCAGARGQRTLIGSPETLLIMCQMVLAHGVDGFPIQPAYLPGGLDDFADLVILELQERDLFRTEYEGTTLRENLALKRRVSRYRSS
jgi:alkanesulfonate monooxygenase